VFRPVDKKEKIILSVARLEEGGTKKQKEMASAFITMKEKYPDITNGWKLIIAGGSTGENIYIRELEEIIGDKKDNPIELKINISDNELKDLYKRSSVFWHLCGLGQNDPAKVEHFGMTIGEAMQNRIAPIVFDGGGQREIVEHGISGFRISSLSGLINYTINVMGNREFLEKLGKGAYEKSSLFKRERFVDEVRTFFCNIFPGFSNQKS
ncbi:MAG: glycosyltransferase, partial [Candidatus Aminicenantes bacterium]|nr:glycosyltransferase [Candidatus Aminicenantes bacterium]